MALVSGADVAEPSVAGRPGGIASACFAAAASCCLDAAVVGAECTIVAGGLDDRGPGSSPAFELPSSSPRELAASTPTAMMMTANFAAAVEWA